MDRVTQSRRIERGQLRPGDHIFAWRSGFGNLIPHHGIYESDKKVIHFTSFSSGSASSSSFTFCSECRRAMHGGGVDKCCLDCFLKGDDLCLFAYNVPFYWLFAEISSNPRVIANRALLTCSERAEDPPATVLERANEQLDLGPGSFGVYNFLVNNCFDFAFFCKTERAFVSPVRAPILLKDQFFGPGRFGPTERRLEVTDDGPACMIL